MQNALHGDYRGRFAPSPTGLLHLGHAQTALYAWKRAREAHGAFILRMEDIDEPRTVPGAAEAIMKDLRWLGIDWDEGPDIGGPFAPYTQSNRGALYQRALATLQKTGLAYECSCTRKDLRSASGAPHGLEELGIPYPGTCRRGVRIPDRPKAWRFRMPKEAPGFTDQRHGSMQLPVGDWDFVLKRSDGLWAYQLAVVVDDIAMEVSEVVRGDDLLASTPWQLALFEALGASAPSFCHLPLVRDENGTRLSKRNQDKTLRSLREAGESPKAIRETLLASKADSIIEP